jgi:chromosome segregation ATPase
MPAAVRVATVDTETGCRFAGHGTVAINGHAETDAPPLRLGPPRPCAETVSPTLSPARRALADHQATLAKLAAEFERVSKPVDRLRDQLAAANIELQNAEHVLADIDKQHSAAIAKAARENCCSMEPVESAEAEAAVSRARRNVNSVRMALDEVSQDQIRANQNLEAAGTAFDALALRVNGRGTRSAPHRLGEQT